MKTALFTGSFDPVTSGHVSLIKRAAEIFDRVYAAVLINPDKLCMFTVEERLSLLKEALRGIERAEAVCFLGLATDAAKLYKADCIIRGIRNAGDYEYERAMAVYNYREGGIDTLFFDAFGESSVSSTAVKSALEAGAGLSGLVPDGARLRLLKLYAERQKK